jgi:serine/threonine protein kinase
MHMHVSNIHTQEVELLSRLRHRNIIRYIGASLQAPDLCVLTELAESSLSDLLYKSTVKLRLEQMIGFAKHIAKGMKYLHSLKPMIIHRDLKSSNLLVDSAMVRWLVGWSCLCMGVYVCMYVFAQT